jgi:hypothetical protein
MDMGIGRLGFKNLVFKRKFRWTFELTEICGGKTLPPYYVKLASRPNFTVDDTEINYLNARTWIPGKVSWETITVTYLDVASADLFPLYDWLASVYNFADPVRLQQGSKRQDYAAKGILQLYDGCGTPMERWTMENVWPQSVNFGDLDYSDSGEVTIELTLRYSDVAFEALCPHHKPVSCCSGCSGGSAFSNSTPLTGGFSDGIVTPQTNLFA